MDYERHPLSARYPDIVGQAWLDFLDNLKSFGHTRRKVMLYEGKILDGWQLYRGCKELGLTPEFSELPKKIDPAHYVETVNEHRRHEDMDTLKRRACDRRDRVAKLHAAGQSIRSIAEAEDVAPSTVQNDLDVASAQGRTVEPPDGKTTGKDGKKRRARTGKPRNTQKKPKGPKPPKYCRRCTRIGSPSCDACRKKAQDYNADVDRQTAPAKEDGKMDFVAVPFDEMRAAIKALLEVAPGGLKLTEEEGCTELNKITEYAYEAEARVNTWHKRADKFQQQKHHEAKRKAGSGRRV